MRTSVQAAILLLVIAAPAHGQTQAWVDVRPPGYGFAASFPAQPAQTAQDAGDGLRIQLWTLEPVEGLALIIGVSDHLPTAVSAEAQLDGAVRGQFERLPPGSTKRSDTRIQIGGVPGRDVIFDMPDGLAKVRTFLSGTRLYQVVAIASAAAAVTLARDIDRFLQSFTIVGPPPAPAAAALRTPRQWTVLRSAEFGFSIDMPAPVGPPSRGAPAHAGWTLSLDGDTTAYLIGVVEIAETRLRTVSPAELLDNAVKGGLDRVPGGVIVGQSDVTLDGYPGRETLIEAPSQPSPLIMRTRMFIVGKWLYILTAVATPSSVDPAEVDRFLRSFALISR